jgi:uncharacterized protein (TIGR03435 family)
MPDMRLCTICACLISFNLALAQQATDKPAFEVASIKPSDPNPSSPMWTGMSADEGMVRYTNMTLKDCLRAAYRMRDFQIQGPAWMNEVRFQITAKLPAGASMEQIPEMMQSLLGERFKLALRRDSKEQSVYALGLGKNGPSLKPAQVAANNPPETALGPDGRPRPAIMIEFLPSGIAIHAPAATLSVLAETMSRFTERPVVDMTGLEGQHQFDVTFAPEMIRGVPWTRAESTQISADPPAPSLFEAVQQYGLKLEARKAPIEMLTVTHLEKTPTEN